MAKHAEYCPPPQEVAPGVWVRAVFDRHGDDPFAGAPLVVKIEVRDGATHEGARRAIAPALALRDRLRMLQGPHGALALVEMLLTEHRLGLATYSQLAQRMNWWLEEAVGRGHGGDAMGWEWAKALLQVLLPPRAAKRALQEALAAVKDSDCVTAISAEQIRSVVRAWARGRPHQDWLRVLHRLGHDRLAADLSPGRSRNGSVRRLD